MAVLGVSSITPAFPRIIEELNISRTDVGMLITAFTLPGVVLTPFIGILADRWGRRRILVPSLFLFGLAGGACALVTEFDMLIALRVLQGVGAASLGLLNLTILGDLFQRRQRAAAIGLNASVLNIGVAVYPLIGGGSSHICLELPVSPAIDCHTHWYYRPSLVKQPRTQEQRKSSGISGQRLELS